MKVKGVLPVLPSGFTALVAAIANVGIVLLSSSLVIVPVADAVLIIAPLLGLERVTVKVSSFSKSVSPLTSTVNLRVVSSASKVIVPVGKTLLGKTLLAKSAAFALLSPEPATVQ